MPDRAFTPTALDREATFYIAGHRGLVGSAIWRNLEAHGFSNLVGKASTELDLKDRAAVFQFFAETKPRYVVLAAAKVGGILANSSYPVDFLTDNLQIQVNVLDAALKHGVERLLFLGSSCIYPKFAPQPITEDSLLTGLLEETNEAYAIAKIADVMHVQAIRRQHGLAWISAMPTNLYGPGDNFSPTGSHVLPALIRRYDEAARSGAEVVTNWGTGAPRREFLHVDDMAAACLYLMEHYDGPVQVRCRSMSVPVLMAPFARSLKRSETIATVVGYTGQTEWDASKPDGTPQKLLDVTKLASVGWTVERVGDLGEGEVKGLVGWVESAGVGWRLRSAPGLSRDSLDAAIRAGRAPWMKGHWRRGSDDEWSRSCCSATPRSCLSSRSALGCQDPVRSVVWSTECLRRCTRGGYSRTSTISSWSSLATS